MSFDRQRNRARRSRKRAKVRAKDRAERGYTGAEFNILLQVYRQLERQRAEGQLATRLSAGGIITDLTFGAVRLEGRRLTIDVTVNIATPLRGINLTFGWRDEEAHIAAAHGPRDDWQHPTSTPPPPVPAAQVIAQEGTSWNQPSTDPLSDIRALADEIREQHPYIPVITTIEEARELFGGASLLSQLLAYRFSNRHSNPIDAAGAWHDTPRREGEPDGLYAVRVRAAIERGQGEHPDTLEPFRDEHIPLADGMDDESVERDALENADWLRELLKETEHDE